MVFLAHGQILLCNLAHVNKVQVNPISAGQSEQEHGFVLWFAHSLGLCQSPSDTFHGTIDMS